MTDEEPLGLSLTKDHLAAIGVVAVQWSFFESVIEQCLWALLNLEDNRARAVTTHIGNRPRLDMLQALVHEIVPNSSHETNLRKLTKEIIEDHGDQEALTKRRNRVIHADWEIRETLGLIPELTGGATATTYKARGRVTSDVKTFSVSEIRAIARDTAMMSIRLMAWHYDLAIALDKEPRFGVLPP